MTGWIRAPMGALLRRAGLAAVAIVAMAGGGAAEPSVYVLAVGSQDYLYVRRAEPPGDGGQPFFDRAASAPEHSARRVAEAFAEAGAAHVTLLTSDAEGAPGERMVTREDVRGAITALRRRVRDDAPSDPRLVFYFMGHGLGDEAGRYAYLIPGDLVFDRVVGQPETLPMILSAVWNLDVVSALVNFREHDSMRHFDDVFASEIVPLGLFDEPRIRGRRQEMDRIHEERLREGAYLPGGNPPVPFVALFDNCYGDVVQDLTGIAAVKPLTGVVQLLVDAAIAELHTDGLALYAAAPGGRVTDVPDTEVPRRGDGGFERIGPLALHLVSVLGEQQSEPMTMTRFGAAFGAEGADAFDSVVRDAGGFGDWKPYVPAGARLLPRTAGELLLPTSPREPVNIEVIHGTGRSARTCCG